MSELFMECVEEELEPWQKRAPDVYTIDDDDDEPIFVGVISSERKNEKPALPPPQRRTVMKEETKAPPAPPPAAPAPPPPPPKPLPPPPPPPQQHLAVATSSAQVPLTMSVAANVKKAEPPSAPAATPRAVIINNRGYIVTSQQMSNSNVIGSLGSQYPSGTPFTIVKAAVLPGVVHRPQVQQISNNIVTLSNVQSPAVYALQHSPMQHNSFTATQPVQGFTVPTTNSSITDQRLVKHGLPPQETLIKEKKAKRDLGSIKVVVPVENGGVKDSSIKSKCPLCQEGFYSQDALRVHFEGCRPAMNNSPQKHIMLLSEFYYGRAEGDASKRGTDIGSMTFKCQSCLKVLKNNIRFMNHMKHHLELEKQNSESWDSHTTCQHCYRQYMTPFQLQCHVESAHSLIESSTNCKICELAFESEQVLLEHMRDNHKPGEMPYLCQVCNFRSSFFSEVETHFRSVHENTKEMLCPFCLRVLKSTHTYMTHFLRHQKKAIHRCGKCRLNFLTHKEKVEHRTHFHKTFRRPRALEGLAPGTKVTIRASLTGRPPIALPPPHQTNFNPAALRRTTDLPRGVKAKSTTNLKKKGRTSKHNLELRTLRVNEGEHTCIECNSKIDDFFSHFPMVSNCGACKYSTSCKVAIGNHMIRCHSTITKNRFMKMDRRKVPTSLKLSLVCESCTFSVVASNGDLMTKHLTEQPHHICKIVYDKDFRAKDRVCLTLGQPWTIHLPLMLVPNVMNLMPEASGTTVTEAEPKPEPEPEPEPEPVFPEGDQETSTTEVVAGSSEDESKPLPLPLPAPSSSCASDMPSGGCDDKEVEMVEDAEKIPVSDQDEVKEQQLSSE